MPTTETEFSPRRCHHLGLKLNTTSCHGHGNLMIEAAGGEP